MFSLKALLPAALIVAGTATPSLAQFVGALENTSGDVIVTRGEAALAVSSETMSVMSGDCITALTDSTTSVALENGCAITLASGESVVVGSIEEGCESAVTTSATTCLIPMRTDHVSLSQQAPPIDPTVGIQGLGALGATTTLSIVAGVVTVGVLVAANDDDEPASP